MNHESWPSIWARRLVTIPGYFLVLGLAFGAMPLWGAAACFADLASGSGARLPRLRACLFFLWYLVCEAAGVLAAGAIWGFLFAGKERFIQVNAALQRRWSTALFGGAKAIFGFKVTVEGADLGRSGPYLLFVRHSSTADTVLAADLVANPHKVLLKYVLKRELLWDPCLDIVGRRLPNAFVRRGAGQRGEDLTAVRQLAQNLDRQTAVLIYPEGTRFTPAKLSAAVARLREQGQQQLAGIASLYRGVLPPKVGGALALMEAAPGIDVVFLDHAGFEGAASFTEFWRGALVHKSVRARLRRIPAAEIPREGRDIWLFEQWLETDRWVTGGDSLRQAS
jgi:1-acyl-sn-glycerol-3-phosphate acyltransferase